MKRLELLGELFTNKDQMILTSLRDSTKTKDLITLMWISLFFFSAFGFIIGLNHSLLQATVTLIKLPCLFILSTAICFPVLYFFFAMLGLKIDVRQLLAFQLVCLSIMSMILAVFSPISLFFLVTTNSYHFFKLLNVGVFSIAGFIGLYFFYSNIVNLVGEVKNLQNKSRLLWVLRLWLLLFAFVGCQLAYSLSPFFGDPSVDFMLFTEIQSNFSLDVLDSFYRIRE